MGVRVQALLLSLPLAVGVGGETSDALCMQRTWFDEATTPSCLAAVDVDEEVDDDVEALTEQQHHIIRLLQKHVPRQQTPFVSGRKPVLDKSR